MEVTRQYKIAIVVVNYRTPELVIDGLRSLRADAEQGGIAVYVGDADSRDESVERISQFIAEEGLDWALCYDIGRNGGFAFGNNHILRTHVLSDPEVTHIYFLNPDAYVRAGAIAALVKGLDQYPNAGIVGSRLENPDGSLRSYGFRAPTPWREFFRGARLSLFDRYLPGTTIKIEALTRDQSVDWVTGASFMIRREVLDRVGLMDDAFFLYFEETDLMTRARKQGYDVWHISESRVVHLAGQATGVRTAPDAPQVAELSPHWLRSRRRYLRKHHGSAGVICGNAFFLLGDTIYRIHRRLRGLRVENPPHLWAAYMGFKSASK